VSLTALPADKSAEDSALSLAEVMPGISGMPLRVNATWRQ